MSVCGRALLLAAAAALAAPTGGAAAVDHGPWTAILEEYVDTEGRVAYRRLREEAAGRLAAYLATLAAATPDALPQPEALAFWINSYNAVIVAGVLDGHSPESLLGRYRMFRRYRQRVAGAARTPEDIEHGIVRARFPDPRVHFALVCAATSCPKLRREAYTGGRLDAQLDAQGREFLNDPRRNVIDPATGRVALSRIFEWFAGDFTRDGRPLADALAPYLGPAQAELLRRRAPDFLPYDWTLNAQPGERP